MNRIEDIVSAVKLEELKNMVKVGDILQKKEEEEKKKCICKWGIALIGAVILAVVAFAVYKYLSKDNMDDFDYFDDFDDDFEDDFEDFEDEAEDFVDEEEEKAEEAVEEAAEDAE